MPNLADLASDSKFSEDPLKTSLKHLTSALSGVVLTIGEIMKSPRVNDEEYDQMSMIIMALQKSIDHIEFDWPDFDQDTVSEQMNSV